MKRILIIIAICILAVSCQTDELVVNNAPQDNLIGNTSLISKLMQMSQYPTTVDNVVDNTSCFAIQLPYNVVVNGQPITVNDESDYQEIQNILDEDDSNEDTIAIQFPVNVTYADYSEAPLATQSQFNEAIANCTGTIELACIGLSYPLGIKTYNSNNQLAETFNLGSKKGLYEFLNEDLGLYDAVTFIYPMPFSTPNGTSITIENNSQLESTIDSYTDDCTGVIPNPNPVFDDVITQGTWYVSYFFRDFDQTDDYEDFDFTFLDNGTASVSGGSSPITGTWNSYEDSGQLEVVFTFSSSALEELEEDWDVTEFSETLIKMRHVSGGGDDIRYLYLTRN